MAKSEVKSECILHNKILNRYLSSFTAFLTLQCYWKGEKIGGSSHPCTACYSPAKDRIAVFTQDMKKHEHSELCLPRLLDMEVLFLIYILLIKITSCGFS